MSSSSHPIQPGDGTLRIPALEPVRVIVPTVIPLDPRALTRAAELLAARNNAHADPVTVETAREVLVSEITALVERIVSDPISAVNNARLIPMFWHRLDEARKGGCHA